MCAQELPAREYRDTGYEEPGHLNTFGKLRNTSKSFWFPKKIVFFFQEGVVIHRAKCYKLAYNCIDVFRLRPKPSFSPRFAEELT
jgi:hypothetical protein